VSEELKRCPHCGMQVNKTIGGGVYCRNYHCGGTALTIEAWNKRIASPAVKALVKTSTALARELAFRSGTTYGPAPVLEWVYTLSEQTVINFRAALAKVEEGDA